MATTRPPATVPELLTKVTTATGNILKHQEAMRKVAQEARNRIPEPPTMEAEQQ